MYNSPLQFDHIDIYLYIILLTIFKKKMLFFLYCNIFFAVFNLFYIYILPLLCYHFTNKHVYLIFTCSYITIHVRVVLDIVCTDYV